MRGAGKQRQGHGGRHVPCTVPTHGALGRLQQPAQHNVIKRIARVLACTACRQDPRGTMHKQTHRSRPAAPMQSPPAIECTLEQRTVTNTQSCCDICSRSSTAHEHNKTTKKARTCWPHTAPPARRPSPSRLRQTAALASPSSRRRLPPSCSPPLSRFLSWAAGMASRWVRHTRPRHRSTHSRTTVASVKVVEVHGGGQRTDRT